MDNKKHIPVGIYNSEIFIAEMDGDRIRNFDVLRFVSESRLDDLRNPDEYRDYYKEMWQNAVASGNYEEGLDAYIEEIFDEWSLDDDEETFPFKDESGCEYLTEELREAADKFIGDSEDEIVGTWECSGSYFPATRWTNNGLDFKRFDYVFDTPEAKRVAKMYVKSLEK